MPAVAEQGSCREGTRILRDRTFLLDCLLFASSLAQIMQPHAAERRHLERQIAYARPIFMVLALVDLLERPPAQRGPHAVLFVIAYLCVALSLALLQNLQWVGELPLPLPLDLAALAVFLLLTHTVVAFWFVYLFVALSAGIHWGTRRSVVLAGIVTLALLIRTALNGPLAWEQMVSWIALSTGTFAAGAGMAFLGSRQRRHATEQEFLARLTGHVGSGARDGRIAAAGSFRTGRYLLL